MPTSPPDPPTTLDYASGRHDKPAPAPGPALRLAVLFAAFLLPLAWYAGYLRNNPSFGGGMVFLLLGLAVGLPCFGVSFVFWSVGLRRLWAAWNVETGERNSNVRWAIAPLAMAAVALALQTGIAAPGPPAIPGVPTLNANLAAWDAAADRVQAKAATHDAPPTPGGVAIDLSTTDAAGGVWLVTRNRDAGGLFDWYYEGLARHPGPGLDPLGNRGQLTLTPLGNGWHSFSTRVTD